MNAIADLAKLGLFPAKKSFWPGSTIQLFGDSFGSMVAGNFYQVPTPLVSVTGDTSSSVNPTIITNVSSVVGVQVGATITGSGIPNSTTITAVGANSITMSNSATATAAGVALTISGTVSTSGFVTGLEIHSILGWLLAMSGGGLNWDPTTGYGGNGAGLYKVIIKNGGVGYNNPTFTASGSSPTVNAGTIRCTTVNGVIVSAVPDTQGYGFTDKPTGFSQTDGGGGSGAVFGWVIGGHGTLAATSDTTSDMLLRVGDVVAAHPDWVILCTPGTNDIKTNVNTASQIIANITSIVRQLTTAGIRVVIVKIPARRVWGGALTFAQAQSTLLRVNRAIEMLGREARSNHPSGPAVLVADPNKYWVDAADASSPGRAITGMVRSTDNVHPSTAGAFTAGLALREVMAPYISRNIGCAYGQDDFYDATYNPVGNLIGTKGLFLGTGGTDSLSGSGWSGTVATGWTFQRASGTATTSGTVAAQARTDALSGQEQVITLTSATGGGATELYQMRIGTSSSNIAAGDQIYMECLLNLSSYLQVNRIGLTLTETAFGNSQNAYALDAFSDTASYIPPYTTLLNMPLNHVLPGFVRGAADGAFDLYLRTPPLTIRPGTSGYSTNINVGVDAGGGTNGFILKLRNCAVRKVAA